MVSYPRRLERLAYLPSVYDLRIVIIVGDKMRLFVRKYREMMARPFKVEYLHKESMASGSHRDFWGSGKRAVTLGRSRR